MPEATINVSPDYYGGHEPGPAEAERNADIEARAITDKRGQEPRSSSDRSATASQCSNSARGVSHQQAFAQVGAHLDRQPVEKSVFEERNFIGRSRENVRRRGRNRSFWLRKKRSSTR